MYVYGSPPESLSGLVAVQTALQNAVTEMDSAARRIVVGTLRGEYPENSGDASPGDSEEHSIAANPAGLTYPPPRRASGPAGVSTPAEDLPTSALQFLMAKSAFQAAAKVFRQQSATQQTLVNLVQ